MRIVYLNPIGRLGGAETLLLDLLASVREARPDWRLNLIIPEEGLLAERASALGVGVSVVGMPSAVARLGDAGSGRGSRRLGLALRILRALPGTLVYQRRLRRIMKSLRPDIIHSNGFKTHLLSIWSRPAGSRVLWHVHDFMSSRPVMARVMRRLAGGCSGAVTASEHLWKDLRSVCPALPATTVLNAVDLQAFSPQGPACNLDRMSGLPTSENVVRIGLLATMARWKGHRVFLEALARISSALPIRAYIIGDAIYQSSQSQWQLEELRAMARSLGLDGRVGFTGFLPRPAEAIRALDIVAHTSTEPEPFGLAIAEAMACGKAVVTSLIGGPSEFVQDGINGLAHEAGNPQDLADKLERLVTDTAFRMRLGDEARLTAIRLFDRRRLASEMIPVYESLRKDHRIVSEPWPVDLRTIVK
jgi:glycosyltransferase involved in cell wall biosynthesis